MTKRILVVDDEPQIRKFLRISLSAEGYDVVEAPRGEDGISKCATAQPSLVILDLGLPDLDGQQVIGRIREWSDVPIIVLSVRTKDQEKVSALDSGANDYVIKPFSIEELLARIRAALRSKTDAAGDAELTVGTLIVDVPRHKVSVAGQEIKLTRKEFDLLRMLAQNAGRIVTHKQILREVWGPAHEDDVHYLRIYIGHLRQKLGDDPAAPKFIESEPGVGYRLIMTPRDPLVAMALCHATKRRHGRSR
ncbi:MAG: response regulator transcription factor [Rhodomicrobium sp.]|nr:response regulator transcription factor [Rhodomicrobium sp.]